MEVEKEMEYQYDKNDLITNPQKYQKTMFLGNNFLNTYKESREKVIKKISVNEKKINFNKNKDVRIILKKEKFDVEELLAAILNNKKKLDLENNKIIEKLLKKFEIKKRKFNKINNKFEETDNEYNNSQSYSYYKEQNYEFGTIFICLEQFGLHQLVRLFCNIKIYFHY